MNSPYISIDIETTGTDPERHQVLEIAAVYNRQEVDVMNCPRFQRIIDPGEIIGTSFALNMNARILACLASGGGHDPRNAMDDLMDWVDDLQRDFGIKQFHLIGKNVGAFDLQFLKRMPGWGEEYFSYRHMEIGSIFSTPEGISGQSELLCAVAADAKIEGSPHEALYDARVSLELARRFWDVACGMGVTKLSRKPEETA
jgi:oligoribonuclease (3'-5' exoribonuclease)